MQPKTEPDQDELVEQNVAKRLARIAGHAASLQRMWDDGRDCEQMLTQISAVRAGLDQAAKVILENHIDHCVSQAVSRGDGQEAIQELKKTVARIL